MKMKPLTSHQDIADTSPEYATGKVFRSAKSVYDFSNFQVLNNSVDTVRQLYKGLLHVRTIKTLEYLTNNGPIAIDQSLLASLSISDRNSLSIPCDEMMLSRMGKMSGYRFKLQNAQTGLILLIGSYYSTIETEGSHLKIELSPNFINARTPVEVQKYMDDSAAMFFESFYSSGCSVHLAVDYQGFDIADDMADNMKTRSRLIKTYKGIGKAEFEGDINKGFISTYSRSQSVTVGNPSSVQMNNYIKSLEVIHSDSVDYYMEQWISNIYFDPEQNVNRLEMRFHHSVIQQFAKTLDKPLNDFLSVSDYLDNLWIYALDTHIYTTENWYIHPLWSILSRDVQFNGHIHNNFKRTYGSKTDVTAVKTNINLMMGNLISLMARSDMSSRDIIKSIKNSPSIIKTLRDYFYQNIIDESIYFQHMEKRIQQRRLTSKLGIAA